MHLIALLLVVLPAMQGMQPPVLEFPEAGLDDAAAYHGYTTRFFRDARGNAFQVYLDGTSGRVVHVWADASNASAAFTVRDTSGQPAPVTWGAAGAVAGAHGSSRLMRHRLAVGVDAADIGWLLLGTMRQERDFQYQAWHLRPYGDPPFVLRELVDLIEAMGRLPTDERERQLSALNARSLRELRSRLTPRIALTTNDSAWVGTAEYVSLDGRNRMSLTLTGDTHESTAQLVHGVLSVRAAVGHHLHFDVIAATDAEALTPLAPEGIFNDTFRVFVARQRQLADSASRTHPPGPEGGDSRVIALRRLDREVRGLELLSAEEKLLASLPNYATYFGRDMMMSALMLEPIVSVDVTEHVIASVLRKVAPSGDVSHEEALGGQAIRENAAEYAGVVREWEMARRQDTAAATALLARARALVADLQAVRENYRMIDDDFQLPVLVGRYLSRQDVSAERKRRFLTAPAGSGVTRLEALVRNLALVTERAEPFAQEPHANHLVEFRYRDDRGWIPGSWRDSRAGYGNGRFAMDVNVIWVPNALRASGTILRALSSLGLSVDGLLTKMAGDHAALARYHDDSAALDTAIARWRGARRLFEVRLDSATVEERVRARVRTRSADEQAYWEQRLPLPESGLSFLALALDSLGHPIPAPNTDVATDLFLADYTEAILRGTTEPGAITGMLDVVARPYPVGLLVEGVGPVVVNDAYADRSVQRQFDEDLYHSPRVVWGREVNLLLLGLARQIAAGYDTSGNLRDGGDGFRAYIARLRALLDVIQQAVETSGLRHNELWSYRVDGGVLRPTRYGTSSDIQLWNLTDLAVRVALDGLPPR